MSIKLFVRHLNPLEDSDWTSVTFAGENEDLLSFLVAAHWQRMGFEVGMVDPEDPDSVIPYLEPI